MTSTTSSQPSAAQPAGTPRPEASGQGPASGDGAPRACVVVPVFNEEQNLPELNRRITGGEGR